MLRVRFVAVTDEVTKQQIAPIWKEAFAARRASHFDPETERLRASGDDEAADKLAKVVASSQYLADHVADAGLILFAFGAPGDEPSVFPAMWSACLAARALGIGSVFTRILVRDACEEVEQILGADDPRWRLQGVLPMGRPLGRWGVAPRPASTDACFGERWGNPVTWSAPHDRWWAGTEEVRSD